MEIVELLLDRGAGSLYLDNEHNTPWDPPLEEVYGDICDLFMAIYKDRLVSENGSDFVFHAIFREATNLHRVVERPRGFPNTILFIRLAVGTLEFAAFRELLLGFLPPRRQLLSLPAKVDPLRFFECLLASADFNPTALYVPDTTGALPMHACGGRADLDSVRFVFGLHLEALRIPDNSGALPIHHLCGSGCAVLNSVRFLVEGGGDDTLRFRDQQGALLIHHFVASHTDIDVDDDDDEVADIDGVESIASSGGDEGMKEYSTRTRKKMITLTPPPSSKTDQN